MRGGQRLGSGRPKDPGARTLILQVRVNEEECERIKKTAAHYGMTVSELVRKALGL